MSRSVFLSRHALPGNRNISGNVMHLKSLKIMPNRKFHATAVKNGEDKYFDLNLIVPYKINSMLSSSCYLIDRITLHVYRYITLYILHE